MIEKDYPERGKYFSLERKKSANDVNENLQKNDIHTLGFFIVFNVLIIFSLSMVPFHCPFHCDCDVHLKSLCLQK